MGQILMIIMTFHCPCNLKWVFFISVAKFEEADLRIFLLSALIVLLLKKTTFLALKSWADLAKEEGKRNSFSWVFIYRTTWPDFEAEWVEGK